MKNLNKLIKNSILNEEFNKKYFDDEHLDFKITDTY